MQKSFPSDSTLVSNYIQGNEYSLEVLVMRHKQNIFGYIYSKVSDRVLAEDIFQDTFIKVIKTLKQGKYNEEGKFLPWVMRIAHNLIIDFYRKSNRIPKFKRTDEFDIFSILSEEGHDIETKMVTEQAYKDLVNLIQYLPAEQKEVLKMRIYNELSFKEIADQTDVSINTVLGRMRYAIINMRKLIKKHEIVILD
ncbi:MAG: RNA polymerase sigma factor [Flavicella sp.]